MVLQLTVGVAPDVPGMVGLDWATDDEISAAGTGCDAH
jgi:hypothetical protein